MRFLLLTLLVFRVYAIPFSHEFALTRIEFANPKKSIPFTGFFRISKQTKQFFFDLGANFISKEKVGFDGFTLNSEDVRKNSGKVFAKWKKILKHPKSTKLLDVFEGNLASSNLRELFCFPREVTFQKSAKNKTVLVFLDYKIPAAMQMREILNFSLRGFSVVVVDFYTHANGKYFPTWEECKKNATSAFNFVSKDVILYGKSFGSAAAIFLGAKHPNCTVILDRPFLSMKEVAPSLVYNSLIKTNYAYSNHIFIKKLQKAPLIISSSENPTFKDHAETLLSLYLDAQHLSNSKEIKEKNFIHTRGGHYSALLNKGKNSWFSYNDAQHKLNKFILGNLR